MSITHHSKLKRQNSSYPLRDRSYQPSTARNSELHRSLLFYCSQMAL